MNRPTGETLPKVTEEARISMTGTLLETADTPEIEAPQEADTQEANQTEDATQAGSAPRAGVGTVVATATTAAKEAATATTAAKIDRAATRGTRRTVSVSSVAINPKSAGDPIATIGLHATSPRNGQEEKPKS